MALGVRHPLWISVIKPGDPGAYGFAALYFLESLARASLVTVISLQAYEILQDEQKVSFLFTGVAAVTFCLSFAVPYLIKRTARRYIYSFGLLLVVIAALGLTTGEIIGQTVAMLCRIFGTCCLTVTLSLYIMDYIRKQDLVKSEPIRLVYSTLAWVVAPFLGVFLWREFGMWATASASIGAALVNFAVFWYLRMSDKIKAAIAPPVNPFKNFFRFWSQPRLRLAWLLAFSRTNWWLAFYIYTPIYMVTAGVSEYMAAMVVLLGNLSLLVNIFTTRMAKRMSLKRLLFMAYGAAGIFSFTIGFLHDAPYIAAAFFILTSLSISITDGVLMIPFMRAVHPYEREAMTAVFRSFADTAELLAPLVYGLVLFILPFSFLFSVLGGWLFLTAVVTFIFLPKRL